MGNRMSKGDTMAESKEDEETRERGLPEEITVSKGRRYGFETWT